MKIKKEIIKNPNPSRGGAGRATHSLNFDLTVDLLIFTSIFFFLQKKWGVGWGNLKII